MQAPPTNQNICRNKLDIKCNYAKQNLRKINQQKWFLWGFEQKYDLIKEFEIEIKFCQNN